jgi:DNA-binding response OmpR family regulator
LLKAKELRPALITLDVIMPDMDGWVVLSMLEGRPGTGGDSGIMLTVRADQDFGFSMGVADYMQKPIERDRLLSRLGTAISASTRRITCSWSRTTPNHARDVYAHVDGSDDLTVTRRKMRLAALESITPATALLDHS